MSALYRVSGDWDEDGFHLALANEDGDEVRVVIHSTDDGRDVLAAVKPLEDWVAEEARERAAYDAATPEERARVLGVCVWDGCGSRDLMESGYCPDHDQQARYETVSEAS